MFFNCTECPLGSTNLPAVGGEGPTPADIMVVGQNPGRNEARVGSPFIGRSGQLFNSVLAEVGLDRSKIFVTNMVKHLTPENRMPLPTEVTACSHYLDDEYRYVNPLVVVLMGGLAQAPIFGSITPTKANGMWTFDHQTNRAYVATFHPAYIDRERQLFPDWVKIWENIEVYTNVLRNRL